MELNNPDVECVEKRLQLYLKYLLLEMEAKLNRYYDEIEGKIKLKEGKWAGHFTRIGEFGGKLVGASPGIAMAAVGVPGAAPIGVAGSGLGEKVAGGTARKVQNHFRKKIRHKQLDKVSQVIDKFTESKKNPESFKDWKKSIMQIGFDIFQSYEMQMMNVESYDFEQYSSPDVMHLLAKDAVDRLVDDAKNEGLLRANGITSGVSKRKKIMTTHYGFKIKLNGEECTTSDLYTAVGWVEWDRKNHMLPGSYYQTEGSNPERYGFRRRLKDENFEQLKSKSTSFVVSQSSPFTMYQYRLDIMDLDRIYMEGSEALVQLLKITDAKVNEESQMAIMNETRDDVRQIFSEVKTFLDAIEGNKQLVEKLHDKTDNILELLVSLVKRTTNENLQPIMFDVRYPDKPFTGRVMQLTKLHDMLQSCKSAAIVGLGGIGKTQLALKYIQLYRQEYNDNVIWINTETEWTTIDSFRRLAHMLKITLKNSDNTDKDTTDIVKDVYRFLSRLKYLLIFDNADKPIADYFYPGGPQEVYILITSRFQKLGDIKVFHLDTFTEEEAKQFIKSMLQIKDNEGERGATLLAQLLHYFPLAIKQATAYINEMNEVRKNVDSSFTIADYLKSYNEKKEELLNYNFSNEFGNASSQTTFTTWTITMSKIKENQSYGMMALSILNTIAYMASENIDVKMFLENRNEIKVGSAVELLKVYSIVTIENSLMRIHPLIQEVTRLNLKQENTEYETLVEVNRVLKAYCQLLSKSSDYIIQLKSHFDTFESEVIKLWLKTLPYRRQEVEQNRVRDWLMYYVYNNFSDCLRSRLEELLVLHEHHYGADSVEDAILFVCIGQVYKNFGEEEKQKEMLEAAALKINEQDYCCDNDNHIVAVTLTSLGHAFGCLGDVEKQKGFLERALVIHGPFCHNGPDCLCHVILTNLGSAYGSLGLENEKDLLERVLAKKNIIKEKHFGPADYRISLNTSPPLEVSPPLNISPPPSWELIYPSP